MKRMPETATRNETPDLYAAEASNILRQIARLKLEIDQAKSEAQNQINTARAEMVKVCKPRQKKIALLEAQLQKPALQLAAARPYKTRHIPFGTLIMAAGKPRIVPVNDSTTEEQIAERLIEHGYPDCVKKHMTINREVLRAKNLPERILREIGVEMHVNGRLRYRLDREQLPEASESMELRDAG